MALTLGLTGRFARQSAEAAAGVRLWAESTGLPLTLVDDRGSPEVAIPRYAEWARGVDLLIGPYSSALVRAVTPVVRDADRLLWNHGGSADDLARTGVASLPAPASSYFLGAVDEAVARGVAGMIVVRGTGPFARAVAEGALGHATARGRWARVVDAEALREKDTSSAAVLVVGDFEHDVRVVRRLHSRRTPPPLVGAVAAGIPAFGAELGADAEGVVGPAQWWPSERVPEIGPSGTAFAADYRRRTGREPSYVAAQAAAAGYLAHAAHRRGLTLADMPRWRTSTLLGEFALDDAWRQVGHRAITVCWRGERMVPLTAG